MTSRFDPLWVVTRFRATTFWLHQQQSGKIRKVHREKVRLADPNLAWDEINPRPIRQHARRNRYKIRRVEDNDPIVLGNSSGQRGQSERAPDRSASEAPRVKLPLLRTPPLRLKRTPSLPDREIQLRSSDRLANKRHSLAPSPIEQTRARWEVVSFVSVFTSP